MDREKTHHTHCFKEKCMFERSRKSKGKHLWIILALLALGISLYATEANCALLGQAEVQKCTYADFADEENPCERKTILTLSVSYGKSMTMELIDPLTVKDESYEETPLGERVILKVTKTPPHVIYPLKYYHTVAYYPHEEVVKVENSIPGIGECNDSPTTDYPTCGWTFQGEIKIEHSQGFCCNKSWQSTAVDEQWRGEELLGEKSDVTNSFSTAHCLRQGELFYHGYEILKSSKMFSIHVSYQDWDGGDAEFDLTPADPIWASWNQPDDVGAGIKGELLGDQELYEAAPDLSNYILYIPASPATHPYVQNYAENMLLVPREETSKDGSECNKVGTSFETFRKEGKNSCGSSEAGDCLSNTLYHKHIKDMELLSQDPNLDTEYLVMGMNDFKGSMDFQPGSEKQLVYRLKDSQDSQVAITMNVAGIKLETVETLARIVFGQVEDFDSMSKNGVMRVVIQNIEETTSDYIVTVAECNMNINEAIPAQSTTLEGGEEKELTFDIKTAFNLETSNMCVVRLKSQEGREYESLEVVFDTFPHSNDYSWDLTEKNEASE